MDKLEIKLKKFLEITFSKLKDENISIIEIENVIKSTFKNIDESTDNLIKEAKKELENTDLTEFIDLESIKKLENLNSYFNSIYSVIKAIAPKNNLTRGRNKEINVFDTFALPTTGMMFAILPMFAGKPHYLLEPIKKILAKEKGERTEEEQNEADKFVESVFKIQKNISYFDGIEEVVEKGFILICDNPKVQAKAEASEVQIKTREGLIPYIKSAYGAEGLRHFLAILVGLEENGRTGSFRMSINDHLDRLGYKRTNDNAHKTEYKKLAVEIIHILSNLFISIISKKNKTKASIKGIKLFELKEFQFDIEKEEMMNGKFLISTTDWYNEAFKKENEQTPQYTKMLKSITYENHREHPIAIYFTTLLSIFFRINKDVFFEISVKKLFEWCDINIENNKNKSREINNLEEELNYMEEKEYIGSWSIKNQEKTLSECKNPLDAVLVFYPPNWLMATTLKLKDTKEKIKEIETKEIISLEKFLDIFEKSDLSIKDFSEKLDITPRMFHLIKNQERKISEKVSQNLLKNFYELL